MANILALITTAIAALTAAHGASRPAVTAGPVVSTREPGAAASTATAAPPAGLLCIRGPWAGHPMESDGEYQVVSPYGDGGAYQYKPSTWAGYGGYTRAELAPPAVQDARARQDFAKGPAVRHLLWPHTSRVCEAWGL